MRTRSKRSSMVRLTAKEISETENSAMLERWRIGVGNGVCHGASNARRAHVGQVFRASGRNFPRRGLETGGTRRLYIKRTANIYGMVFLTFRDQRSPNKETPMQTETIANGTLQTWTPQEVAEAYGKGEIVLIDVRTPAEYMFEHVDGAMLAPMSFVKVEPTFPTTTSARWSSIAARACVRSASLRCASTRRLLPPSPIWKAASAAGRRRACPLSAPTWQPARRNRAAPDFRPKRPFHPGRFISAVSCPAYRCRRSAPWSADKFSWVRRPVSNMLPNRSS
jgi:hypothetical protein